MSNNKQSSVEFIKNNLERLGMLDNGIVMTNIFQQAKAMHKEEIVNAYRVGKTEINIPPEKLTTGQQYYNETYGGNK